MHAISAPESFTDELLAIGLDIALHQSGIALIGAESVKLYQLNVDDVQHESKHVTNYTRRNGGGSKYQAMTQNISFISNSF